MTNTAPTFVSLRGQYAGFVTRAAALVLDMLLVVVAQVLIVAIVQLVLSFFGLGSLLSGLAEMSRVMSQVTLSPLVRWLFALLGSAIGFSIYLVFFWVLIDRTVGQALLGLRVLRSDGQTLSFWRAVRRALAYYLAALPFFLGFLWVLVDDRRQGWHDKLADTVVIYDWDARLGGRFRSLLTREPVVTVESADGLTGAGTGEAALPQAGTTPR